MKIAITGSNVGTLADRDAFETLVRTAEEVGFESIWTFEHVVVPVGYESPYPYSPDGKMPVPDSTPIPDPVLPLALAAGITERIKLGTGVMILPQRHPAYVAKELATLDVLSRGRALLGVGVGWLEEEFETVGVPFNERGVRTDEAIRAVRHLWQPKPAPFEGRFYPMPAVESNPKPLQQGGVPIIVGGNAPAAARRAARLGDGFFPGPGELESLLGVMRDECGKRGRDPAELEISTMAPPDLDLSHVEHFGELGVSRLAVVAMGLDGEAIRRELEKVGDRVIAKL